MEGTGVVLVRSQQSSLIIRLKKKRESKKYFFFKYVRTYNIGIVNQQM
jgi:hypothetical protein